MTWSEFVMKVHSIAKIGKLFTKDPYALENYEELESLSLEMLNEKILDEPTDQNVYTRDIYPTPNVSTRCIVFNDKNELLLVKEKSELLWSLPGGWCDLYESPSENAKKEVRQESGLDVEIDGVVAVFFRDRYKKRRYQLISEYVIYFKASANGGKLEGNHEIVEVGFFDVNDLPPLSHKNSAEELNRALKATWEGSVEFD